MTSTVAVRPTRWATIDTSLRVAVLLLALTGALFFASGCASRQHQPTQVEDETNIERPAVPLSEEEGLADRIGEVGVVLLVVGVTIGLILIPILLL